MLLKLLKKIPLVAFPITFSLVLVFLVLMASLEPVKNDSNSISKEDVSSLETQIQKSLIPAVLNEQFDSTAIFIYTSDYKYRLFLMSDRNTEIVDIAKPVESDPFLFRNYRAHKVKHCFVEYTDKVPQESWFYRRLVEMDKVSDDVIYASCPLYENDLLIGYVSSIIDLQGRLIPPSFNKLKVLTAEIEVLLNPYF